MKIIKKINWGTLISKNALVFPKVKVGEGSLFYQTQLLIPKRKLEYIVLLIIQVQ